MIDALGLSPRFVVERIEKHNAHYYTIDSHKTYAPGSTTVLNAIPKPALIGWAVNETAEKIKSYLLEHAVQRKLTYQEIDRMVDEGKNTPEKIKTSAGDLGTRAHEAIDAITKGLPPKIDPDILRPVENFLNWQASSNLKIIHGDLKLFYHNWDDKEEVEDPWAFGGSLDGIALGGDGKIVVIDYKTSNKIRDEYAYQVASYCFALNFTYNLGYIPEAYCVRFGKTEPGGEIRKVRNIFAAFQGFRQIYRVWKLLKEDFFEESISLMPKTEDNSNGAKPRRVYRRKTEVS